MNRADRMLEVLADGLPHDRQEIFRRVGFMLTNNAAAELRARGLDVRHDQDGDVHSYRLSLREPDAELAPSASDNRASGSRSDDGDGQSETNSRFDGADTDPSASLMEPPSSLQHAEGSATPAPSCALLQPGSGTPLSDPGPQLSLEGMAA